MPQTAEDTAALRAAIEPHLLRADVRDPWPALVAAGVTGLIVPETSGGLGLSAADAAPVFEGLGAHGLSSAFLETAIVAPVLLRDVASGLADPVLAGIAAGDRVAVAGLDARLRRDVRAVRAGKSWHLEGDARLVLDADVARPTLVAAHTGEAGMALLLVAADASGVERTAYPTIDGRPAADLHFAATPATLLLEDAGAALAEATDAALACIATEAAALMRRLLTDTLAYTKQREQFGQPIAAFQVLQHRMVDMHIESRRAGAIAARTMAALAGDPPERARLASAAKVTAAEAGRFVGQNAVQLHGGMGMTEELPVARLFRRLTAIEHELGGPRLHRRRYAEAAAMSSAVPRAA